MVAHSGAQSSDDVEFQGRAFPVDLASRVALLEVANLARSAVQAGTKPGDLRWNHPARDFAWPDRGGDLVRMDAYTLLALAARFGRLAEDAKLRGALSAQ